MILFARSFSPPFLQLNCETKRIILFQKLEDAWKHETRYFHIFAARYSHLEIPSRDSIRSISKRNIYILSRKLGTFLEDKRGTGSTIHHVLPRLFLRFPFHSAAKNRPHRAGLDRIGRKEKKIGIERVVNVEKDVARLFLFPRSTFLFANTVRRRRLSYATTLKAHPFPHSSSPSVCSLSLSLSRAASSFANRINVRGGGGEKSARRDAPRGTVTRATVYIIHMKFSAGRAQNRRKRKKEEGTAMECDVGTRASPTTNLYLPSFLLLLNWIRCVAFLSRREREEELDGSSFLFLSFFLSFNSN